MSDLISRQAAIDNLKRHLNETDVPDHYPGIFNAIEEWLDDWEVPSAQPEQRWIPCSEMLPENDKRVLATTAWEEVTIAEQIYPPINDTCWFIHDGNTNATIDDVVAWMPLPESYKGE